MKRIIFAIVIMACCTMLKAHYVGIALYGAPTLSKVKYTDFDEFASGYNIVNNTDLKGFTKESAGYSLGADIFYSPFYYGIYYNKLKMTTDPVVADPGVERQFDLKLSSVMVNIGVAFGKKHINISPFVAIGLNSLKLDAYMNYSGNAKPPSAGYYLLDGSYAGKNMYFGFGTKVNLFYSIFYASLGFSKLYSVVSSPFIYDSADKGNPVTGGGYTEIAKDWPLFVKDDSWNYKGEYVSSKNKQFIIQLNIGIFLGKADN